MRLRPLFRRFRTDFLSWARVLAVVGSACGLVGAAAWGAYAEAWPAVVSHAYFRLRSVKVVCDSRAAEPSTLAAQAGLYDGTSLWQIDPVAARTAVTSVPWVKDARIHRRFPDQVSLEVYRRDPVAATVTAEGAFLIDGNGVVYREGQQTAYVDLPYLTGWDLGQSQGERLERLRTAMLLGHAVERIGVKVSQLDVDAEGVYRLYPQERRLVVVLGRDPHPASVAQRLATVWGSLPERADVREIDLSYADRAVLRTERGRMQSVISAMAALTNRGGAVADSASGRGPTGAMNAASEAAPQGDRRG